MSKEIFINTGTSFQQQYIARQPAIVQSPITAQYDAQGNANSQSPFTYQNRTPFTYRNPVNSQTPYIANKQNPYPYIANSQTPYPASAQQPYPYPASAQQPYPYIASARQPGTYQATGRTPFTYQSRQPGTYQHTGRTPFTYQRTGRTPFTYQAPARQPGTYQARQPSTYQRTGRTPFTYQARTPATYQAPARTPYIYTFSSTGTVAKDSPGGKLSQYYYMTSASPSLPCGVLTHRGGGGLRLDNVGSDWTTCRIGPTSSNYSTLTKASSFNVNGSDYYTGGAWGANLSSPIYITNTIGASVYFALLG